MTRGLRVVLDTETTGLGHVARPRRADGVVQVGLAWREPGGPVRLWSRVCDPGRALYEGGRADVALRLQGRTAAALAAAPPAAQVAQELRMMLDALEGAHGPLDLRAYNVDFDRPFLEAEPWGLRRAWGPCIMKAAARLDPEGRWRKLEVTCARLGFPHPGPAHDAAGDAHAALLVMEALERPAERVPA